MNPEKFANQQNSQETSSTETSIDPEKQIEQVEAPKDIETKDEQKTLEGYQESNVAVKQEIARTEQDRDSLVVQVGAVREKLYGENVPPTVDIPSVDAIDTRLEALRLEQIKTSSNYPGDWTLLLRDRMLDPVTKEKFIKTRVDAMVHMKEGQIPPKPESGFNLTKDTAYQEHYQKQIDEYDENVQRIFNSTEYTTAGEADKEPRVLGTGNIGQTGTVFSDAIKSDGSKLTPREKNIIEAHEKGHGIRNFVSSDRQDFTQSIDLDVVRQNDLETGKRQIGYLGTAEEIAERMVQLKNYFGMNASDTFTKDHLKYATEHYLADISLDNNMAIFLKAVTEKTADKFIDTINNYPL